MNKEKTWLELSEEELKDLLNESACMYGGKKDNETN